MKTLWIAVLVGMLAASLSAQTLPDKPQPAYLGQWIVPKEIMPPDDTWPSDLVMVERKDDGRKMWHLERVGTCFYCGPPMSFKQAAFDHKQLPMMLGRIGLLVADIEITHHSPCFVAHTCVESNPLMGKTRAQAYGVGLSITALDWWATAELRRGDLKYHLGGLKSWWIPGLILDAESTVGIVANLARWHK